MPFKKSMSTSPEYGTAMFFIIMAIAYSLIFAESGADANVD